MKGQLGVKKEIKQWTLLFAYDYDGVTYQVSPCYYFHEVTQTFFSFKLLIKMHTKKCQHIMYQTLFGLWNYNKIGFCTPTKLHLNKATIVINHKFYLHYIPYLKCKNIIIVIFMFCERMYMQICFANLKWWRQVIFISISLRRRQWS